MIDDVLSTIRRRWDYRLAIFALRAAVLGIVAAVLLIAAVLLRLDADQIVKVSFGLAFALVGLAVLANLVAVVSLTPHTSRYVGVAGGSPSLRRGQGSGESGCQ